MIRDSAKLKHKPRAHRRSQYYVLYSGRHGLCGREVEGADRKLTSLPALAQWCCRALEDGVVPSMKLHCGKCESDFEPSHVFVVEIRAGEARTLVPVTKVEKFNLRVATIGGSSVGHTIKLAKKSSV